MNPNYIFSEAKPITSICEQGFIDEIIYDENALGQRNAIVIVTRAHLLRRLETMLTGMLGDMVKMSNAVSSAVYVDDMQAMISSSEAVAEAIGKILKLENVKHFYILPDYL